MGRTEKVIPSAEDYYRLLQAAGQTTVGRQLLVWIWLSALAGLRHTESFFLEWADIDFVAKEIRVRPKEGSPLKDREWRKIEIHAQLLPILVDWKAEWDSFFARRAMTVRHDWVFYNPRRPAFRCQTFRKAFESACGNLGALVEGRQGRVFSVPVTPVDAAGLLALVAVGEAPRRAA